MHPAHLVLLVITAGAAPMFAAGPSTHVTDATHVGKPPSRLVQVVRKVTQGLRDPDAAIAAGYTPFLGCVSGPQEGAMGVHYVNGDLVADGALDATQPEALIFEPRNGRPRLVGVEYIVMAEAWHANNETPPTLDGQVFHYNGSPNRYGLPAFYELHVWAWRDNPHGTFADWNPHVSCGGA